LKKNNILDGKNCVITGATGGIGKQIAFELASKNCNLFLIGQNTKKLKSLKQKLEKINTKININFNSTDLTNIEDIKTTIKKIKNEFSPVLILINCAGKFIIKSIEKSTLDDFDTLFNINVKAPFILTKAFTKDMKNKKWGRIMNIGSSSSYNGFSGGTIYSATKHSILGFSRSLQFELKEKNIRVQCFSPSSTQTEMGKISKEQDFSTFLDPKEVAKYIVFSMTFDNEMCIDEVKMNRMIMR
jgi:short-subunit dehydrogenase